MYLLFILLNLLFNVVYSLRQHYDALTWNTDNKCLCGFHQA